MIANKLALQSSTLLVAIVTIFLWSLQRSVFADILSSDISLTLYAESYASDVTEIPPSHPDHFPTERISDFKRVTTQGNSRQNLLTAEAGALATAGDAVAYGTVSGTGIRIGSGGIMHVAGLTQGSYKRYDPTNYILSGQSEVRALTTFDVNPTSDYFHFRSIWATTGNVSLDLYSPGIENGRTNIESGSFSGLVGASSFNLSLDARKISPFGSNRKDSFNTTLIWSINSSLPGSTINNPLQRTGLSDQYFPDMEDREDDLADEPVQVIGSYLTSPVAQGYGLDAPIFFDTSSPMPDNFSVSSQSIEQFSQSWQTLDATESPSLFGNALFRSYDSRFTSFVAPSAIPEIGKYTIRSSEFETQLDPGETFDFRAWDPNGVSKFVLYGYGADGILVDPTKASEHAIGLTFARDGLAMFSSHLIAVPEPSSLAMATLVSFTLLARISPFRKRRSKDC